MFVRARGGERAALGIGKLLSRLGDSCSVEYFDAPTAQPEVHAFQAAELAAVQLPEQTRVYWFDLSRGVWEMGRLLDDHGDAQLIRLPNDRTLRADVTDVYVRWGKPIEDPTPFLAAKVTESPRFSEAREGFVRSVLEQRSACLGMTGLISAGVELEAHQVDVARRVLQDPTQRYLLADEVGLGKTIEAGILIRQCVLDCGPDCVVVVLAPDALRMQWRDELATKFSLAAVLDAQVRIEAFSEAGTLASALVRADMLVVDEAHHLASEQHRGLYALLAAVAPSIERVLLLSATPVLHNERSFHEMLHLLDSNTYRTDQLEDFRRQVGARQELAEIVAMLRPENALYLDRSLDRLMALFPADDWLIHEAEALRDILHRLPEPNDPELSNAIGRMRAHVSEVYRLDRRILRNRRKNNCGLTPGRGGAALVEYKSPVCRTT